jgi:adenosylmethionine-8-amino-7-oxononanoate aminotransferase
MMGGLELAVENAADLADRIRAGGVIVRASGQKLVLSPPLVIERAEIDTMLEVLERELARTPTAAVLT